MLIYRVLLLGIIAISFVGVNQIFANPQLEIYFDKPSYSPYEYIHFFGQTEKEFEGYPITWKVDRHSGTPVTYFSGEDIVGQNGIINFKYYIPSISYVGDDVQRFTASVVGGSVGILTDFYFTFKVTSDIDNPSYKIKFNENTINRFEKQMIRWQTQLNSTNHSIDEKEILLGTYIQDNNIEQSIRIVHNLEDLVATQYFYEQLIYETQRNLDQFQ